MTATDILRVGDEVRYHSYSWGWRFGKVIGLHTDTSGIGATGLAMATVRFHHELGGLPTDAAIPVLRLDRVE